MELLIELQKLQAMGTTLSFPLSMDEPEWKLKHELERHLAHQTLVQRITLVKGILKVGSMVVRILCSSFLGLEGWDVFIAKELDSGKYDTSLEQVYRQMFGKGTPNPWISLGLLIIGSAIAFHVGSLMSNQNQGQGSAPASFVSGILSSLFGSSTAGTPSTGGVGGLPMAMMGNVLRMVGGSGTGTSTATSPNSGSAQSAPVRPVPQAQAPPLRPPSPPPVRNEDDSTVLPGPTAPRIRPRITPPSV